MKPFPPGLAAAAALPLISLQVPAECEPTNFRIAVPFLGSTTLEMSWDDNCDDETEYEFQVKPEGQDFFTVAFAPANSTLIGIPGGGPNQVVSFRMRTVRAAGNSDWTEGIEVTLPADLAIDAGLFVGGTVGEELSSPAPMIFTLPAGGSADSFGVTDLPPGLDFDTSTGVVSGTPTAPGVFRPIISATEEPNTVTTFLTMRIKPAISGPVQDTPVPDFLFLSPPTARICHDLAPHFSDPDTTTAVRIETNLGNIDTILYPQACPAHVENLLNYVNRGDYNGVVFHRSAIRATSGVDVIQAGWFKPDGGDEYSTIPLDPAVVNEPGLSNEEGTIAQAKLGGDPDSGTSQWYFNTSANTALDSSSNNGGFTVFGRASTPSLAVIDDISNRPRGSYSVMLNGVARTIGDWPTTAAPVGATPALDELVQIGLARRLGQVLFYRLDAVSNPDLALFSVQGTQVKIEPLPELTGTSTLTVEVTDLDGTVLPIEISYCVLDLDLVPGVSPGGNLAATFTHEKLPADLSYEAQSSTDGQNWTSFWRTSDGVGAPAVITNDDLGTKWRLTVEDTDISTVADQVALVRIVVTKG